MKVKASTQFKREHKADYGKERIEILYEDEYLCVINKPTGMLSCSYPGSRARTAQDALEQIMRKKGTLNANHKPLVVHRLDRDTSGVMMFAFTETAQKVIMDTWHKMVTERLYHAIAENPKDEKKILPDNGLIDDPLTFNAHNVGYVPNQKNEGHFDSSKMSKSTAIEQGLIKSDPKIKTVPARTNFRVIERGKTHTLFELSLDTGKKNQIRAHLSNKGYPLAGDENYRARTDHFHRLCLHARTLEFIHPFTEKKMMFQVPEPQEWIEYVKKGDSKPETPIWNKEFEQNKKTERRSSKKENGNIILGEKRISAKEKAHSNFIELGKRRR